LDSKHVVQLLRERGLDVNGPSNTIPSIYADALIEEIGDKKLVFKEKKPPKASTKAPIEEDNKILSDKAGDVLSVSNAALEAENTALELELEQKLPLSEGKPPPPEQELSPSESELAPSVEESPPPELEVSPPEEKLPPLERKSPPEERKSPPPIPEISKSSAAAIAKDQLVEPSGIGVSQRGNTQDVDKRKNAVVVSVASLDKNKADKNKRKADEPDVRLPELPKKRPVQSETDKNNSELAEKSTGFKPFLKKIERQPKTTNLKAIEIKLPVIIRTLATQMNVKPFQLISKLMSMNIFASMNQEIDISVAQSVAEKFGYALELAKPEPEKIVKPKSQAKVCSDPVHKKGQNLIERPPVVCVLGHVDHGKTTLLDTIRSTRVAAGEAGGITQHVAAYQIEQSGKKITFIDTPGHAAFSKMRERGANMTDIGVLVVAADDGFMPQTDEALKFAKRANIPVVVAINKIDSKGANVDRVKQQMQQRGITSEDWGGETLCASISALKGTNVENLLELVRLQAEMMELRANVSGSPEGVVLESKVATGHGATASVIVQDGTLKIGNCVICGQCYCKVKSLIDDRGRQVKEAPASMPVSVVGWSAVPEVGAKFSFVESEKIARKLAEDSAIAAANEKNFDGEDVAKISNIDQLFSAIAAVEEKFLNVIVRADVHGSAEALCDFLGTIKSKKIKLNIVDCGIGAVNKTDVTAADTSKSQIVAFNVKVESNAQALAKQLGVRIIQHNIIYEIVDQVRLAMADCLDPELHENKLGAAEVRQIFNVKNDIIAGCMVTEGKISRDKFVRVIRDKVIIFQGKFASIKRQKEDTGEVRAGFECGIVVSGFGTFEVGDVIECFEIKKIQPSL
jgi:translation initiation factor IF-2